MSKKKARAWGRWTADAEHFDKGGQAFVYRVTDSTGEYAGEYILKELKNSDRKSRFLREVESLKKLVHSSHIVPIIDFGICRDAEKPCYVMPVADGTLEKAVLGGAVNIDDALRLFDQVCQGARDLHSAGLVHRDLKPDNVLLFSGVAKIADFGLAFDPEEERLTPSYEAVGPRFFMAPELEDGRLEDVTAAADVYSLGKILYFLLTGGVRFSREKHTAREKYDLRVKAIDPRALLFETILARSITPSKADRFKDAGTMYQAYRNAVAAYEAHPHTRVLARFLSLDDAASAREDQLLEMTSLEIGFLLDYAGRPKATPQLSLLRCALHHLQYGEIFGKACRALFAWKDALDPESATSVAAALVLSAPAKSLLWGVAPDVQRCILEAATRHEDINVLNAIGARATLGLRSFPTLIERLGARVEDLAADARRGFLVGCRDVSWPGRENFLLAHVARCEDLIELEAAVAGLCDCATMEAASCVVSLADDEAMDASRRAAVVRGIALGARGDMVDKLRSHGIKNRIVEVLTELASAQSQSEEDATGGEVNE